MRNGVIICLGKALQPTGEAEPMLLRRCDKALEIHALTQYTIINSGADTVGCGTSEAKFMTEYMQNITQNAPIIMEQQANNTVENFRYCLDLATVLQATEIIIVTCQHHMPRAEYVCQAVLMDRGQNMQITTSPSPDPMRNRLQLLSNEYKKIFTTPSYLVKHFNIEPPGELQFTKAKSTLEKLLQQPENRRRSCSHIPLSAMTFAKIKLCS